MEGGGLTLLAAFMSPQHPAHRPVEHIPWSSFRINKHDVIVLQKPSTAVEYLAAHLSKIHGLDWHPHSEHIFATSSQDNSVKVSGPHGAIGGALCDRRRVCGSIWKETCSLLVCSMCVVSACTPGGKSVSLALLTRRWDAVATE